MRTILATIALTLGLAVATTVAASPAQASGYNGILCHYSPDDGYDASIRILYGNGDLGYVFEGDCSPSSRNVVAVYLRTGEEMWCKVDGAWRKSADADNTYTSLGYYFTDGAGCTLRTD